MASTSSANMPSLGRMIRYVGPREEIVVGVVTGVFALGRINAALIRDGVNQAHIDPHVYTVDYAPVDPLGGVKPDTWHWPDRD